MIKEYVFGNITKTQAYTLAYNTENMNFHTIKNKASLEFSKPKILAKVKELQSKIEKKAIEKEIYSREVAFKRFDKNIKELETQLEVAKKLPKKKDRIHFVAVLTKNIKEQEEQKAKLYSLYIERRENKNTSDFKEWLKNVE